MNLSEIHIKPIAAIVLVAGSIFVFDLLLPLGVAGGVPYVVVVMLGSLFPKESHFYLLAAISTVLVVIGFFLSPEGGVLWVVIVNRFLAFFVIWITAWQLVRGERTALQLRGKDQELRRVSRMSDMGLMASELAHEINQPLTAVSGYIQAVRRTLQRSDVQLPDEIYTILEKAAAQNTRAADIIRRLRQFIEKTETEFTSVDINEFVEQASSLALVDAREKGVRVRYYLEENMPLVVIDSVQVQQVIVNLIRNSIDAMTEVARRELTITTRGDGTDQIEIMVKDTGPGLDEEVSGNMFKPFVTTKANGMGVGLSICKSIIDEHGGRLWHTPNPKGGVVFHFTLPVDSKGNIGNVA